MKIDVLHAGRWYRYLGNPISVDGATTRINLEGRAVYGLVKNKDQFILVDNQVAALVPISEQKARELVTTSKPYLGKIQGKDVLAGSSSFDETFKSASDIKPKPKVTAPPPKKVAPTIAGSAKVNFQFIQKPTSIFVGTVLPASGSIRRNIEIALGRLGTKIKFKYPISLGISNEIGSCIAHSMNRTRGTYDIYIILNPGQLTRIFGSLSVDGIAQVLTHELAHYAIKNVLKNSDVIKFKKQVAAKRLHKDQFNHPGYANPWWDEAFAILVEAMVHGQSVRGFTTPVGWEIAEKYFVNQYLVDGQYSGSYKSM